MDKTKFIKGLDHRHRTKMGRSRYQKGRRHHRANPHNIKKGEQPPADYQPSEEPKPTLGDLWPKT